jgi:hypothetical protein
VWKILITNTSSAVNANAVPHLGVAASGLAQVFADVVDGVEVGVGASGDGAAAAQAAIESDALGQGGGG